MDALIAALRRHENGHKDDKYYRRVREQKPKELIDIAARFIYLNKTCFNGLYRVNKQGKFNVPKGSYKNPDICNEDRLRTASTALQKATILYGDFERIVKPDNSDFIYSDPPYDDCFVGYQAGGFGESDQRRLRDAAMEWSNSGARVLLSNSDTPLVRRLYKGAQFNIHEASAPRSINRNANGRGRVPELLVATYD